MTFNFVEANWNLRTFHFCFFDTEVMGKSAGQHEAITTAAVRDNDKLGSDALVFSETSDNEPSVALGVDRYLNFSGAVRCCCHTLALTVNDAVRNCNAATTALQRINCISAYLNTLTPRGPSSRYRRRLCLQSALSATLGTRTVLAGEKRVLSWQRCCLWCAATLARK